MNTPAKEFHVSRASRDRYQFDQALFTFSGNVIFANFQAARVFAQQMNAQRDLVNHPERAVNAGQINAMGLIDEMLHLILDQYRKQRNPGVMQDALSYLYDHLGPVEVNDALRQFTLEFPPLAIYRAEVDTGTWLYGETGGVPHSQVALEEMLMLWLANLNPAFGRYQELFNDTSLVKNSAYLQIVTGLKDFFQTRPVFGPEQQNIIDLLRAPALASPGSLEGQLEYIRSRWSPILGEILVRLLSSLDLIKEEEKAFFPGPGPVFVPEFASQELEIERFSPDRDWMPNLVLIAKNSYVWLDQLSKKFKQPIKRLDQIPDQELDSLARWGFTGLWLIGLWERSPASKRIKQLRGNPDAVASAYSLFGYDIANDLGGEEAYRNLSLRCWQRGIRLASDMVPNHMGIDSRWVIEHPDWFISLDHSPFPTYSFNGPNLSWDGRVGIYLEDHYYNNSDAAVVFKRVDFWTGSEKYIYHGNDGTSMPWNDTAQLNYLLPEVREAVIHTILHVARKFPVIRFDAAMTLAKRHFQRLWYPEPGSGGDIPSRAGHGLTKEQFDAAIPEEFWREVVDRIAQELPDTLLLAEAFWMMEGYFVRTLGMHRVYNSAFMNMLRDEKNQEYRLVIKNTIDFEPEILKRYVNFMNNPDERTAIDQFGKGDKYFGICTLMATLPGLPMFGHGQIEGFSEKYGMEFQRAYWDEIPDQYLVERHTREIFPLLRRRYLFAEVQHFLLYDFYTPEGQVDEDVFAYSNREGDDCSLVFYHNRYSDTRGWINASAAYSIKSDQGDERILIQSNLGAGLDLANEADCYVIFRDYVQNLEYIRNCQEIHQRGLYIELGAYHCHVFLNFRQVKDDEQGQYAHLASLLEGRGVPSIDEALKEIDLQPILEPYRALMNANMIGRLIDCRWRSKDSLSGPLQAETLNLTLAQVEQDFVRLLLAIQQFSGSADKEHPSEVPAPDLAKEIQNDLINVLSLPALVYQTDALYPLDPGRSKVYTAALRYLSGGPNEEFNLTNGSPALWGVLFAWIFTRKLGKILKPTDDQELTNTWLDEWLLAKSILSALQESGLNEWSASRGVALVRILVSRDAWYKPILTGEQSLQQTLEAWFADPIIQRFLGVNRYQDHFWFNKESFEELIWWFFTAAVIGRSETETLPSQLAGKADTEHITACYTIVMKLLEAESRSSYQVEKLIEGLLA